MEETSPPTDPADSTSITVILIPILVIEQITHQACIPSKSDTTFLTLGLHPLPRVTFCTDQLRYRFTIEKMRFVFVMAVSTHVELVAAWCHKLGPSLIVCTSDSFLSILFFLRFLLFRSCCSHLSCSGLPSSCCYCWDSRNFRPRLGNNTVTPYSQSFRIFHNFRHQL